MKADMLRDRAFNNSFWRVGDQRSGQMKTSFLILRKTSACFWPAWNSQQRGSRWWQLEHFFLLSPLKLGEDEPILTVAYFSNGLVQPPTRHGNFQKTQPVMETPESFTFFHGTLELVFAVRFSGVVTNMNLTTKPDENPKGWSLPPLLTIKTKENKRAKLLSKHP